MKAEEFLLPREEVLDRLKYRAYGRSGELLLTDARVLTVGYTGALGPRFTLLRGEMAAGFPLAEYDSFILGTGRRPGFLLASLTLAVAAAVLLLVPMGAAVRYEGLVTAVLSLFSFLAWTAWPRTFITVSAKDLKISGRVSECEAAVFLERLQLAAQAAREGKSRAEIKQAASLSDQSCPEEGQEAETAEEPAAP